jgi:FkbM family methyltransferase
MCDIAYKVDYSNKSFFFFTLENCGISNTIKANQLWEPYMHDIFDKYITKESVVIECGCHIGTHTLKMASLCDKLYGFEPMPETYDVLNKNIQLNSIHNATIYKQGVADKPGRTRFSWIPHDNPGGSGLENNPMGKPTWIEGTNKVIDVELTTIDALNLEKLDFMKIDVEGYESLAIAGGFNTIQKCKPVIVMEVWKNHFGGVDINYTQDLFKNLIDIGYELRHLSGPDFIFLPN